MSIRTGEIIGWIIFPPTFLMLICGILYLLFTDQLNRLGRRIFPLRKFLKRHDKGTQIGSTESQGHEDPELRY